MLSTLKLLRFTLCCLMLPLLLTVQAHHNAIEEKLIHYRASPKLIGPAQFISHASDDVLLNKLDDALAEISNVYMQALLSGTHTPELESRMRSMEIELFDLLDQLYQAKRLNDYMHYEAEVTRQMIIYNMLKKLFGYATDENESY